MSEDLFEYASNRNRPVLPGLGPVKAHTEAQGPGDGLSRPVTPPARPAGQADRPAGRATSPASISEGFPGQGQYGEISSLTELREKALVCRKCRLCETRRTVVFGEGNPRARILFIGEGPGRTEDETGRPFVGRAGELLTRIIEKGMGLQRSDVYIANVVKCRPTIDGKGERDRPPDPDETAACSPFLLRQIELIRPEAIVTLGNPSTRFLLRTTEGITKLRGHRADFCGIPVVPTYHPSYVLRNGGENSPLKKDVWQDIKKVMALLGLQAPAGN